MAGREAPFAVEADRRRRMSLHNLSSRRILVICIALIAAGIFFISWQHQRTERKPQLHFDSLILERTPCFGPCPVYKVTVERSGQVTYQADDFNPMPGAAEGTPVVRHGRMLESALHELIAAVESMEYAELKREYFLQITDMPSTKITVSANGLPASTLVYAVPCKKDAEANSMYQSMKSQSPPVPDIFCKVEELVDDASCAKYWGQSTRAFLINNIPDLPVPSRCQVSP